MNLPARVVGLGAKVAIGFNIKIDCGVANTWTREFYTNLLSGATVHDAVSAASEKVAFAVENVIVCGNEFYRLYE